MDLSINNIKTILARKDEDTDAETLIGEVAIIDRASLISTGESVSKDEGDAHSDTEWSRCPYVFVVSEDPDNDIPTEVCLEGWKALSGASGDQTLVFQVSPDTWELYDHNATLIGGNAELESLVDTLRPAEANQDDLGVDRALLQPYIDLLLENYNLVLTGAPGTGKTFLAKAIAKGMGATDDTVKFVQFHPSYDYTDFVEGLRPKPSGDGKKTKSTSLIIERRDGVFKNFCKDALLVSNTGTTLSRAPVSFKNLLDSIKDDIDKGLLKQYSKTGRLSVNAKTKRIQYKTTKREKTVYEDNLELLFNYYVDHPDEFKTISQESMEKRIAALTASRPKPTRTLDYTEYNWTLTEMLKRKEKEESDAGEGIGVPRDKTPYVFIIDEINRGELSKIFGELFFSIDPGYRGVNGKVTTQYQELITEADDVFRGGFYVPENVYIIGTMNDIDRGVESMDFAIRRRFAWREVTAEESAKNMNLSPLATELMQKLNKAIKEAGLGEEYFIGGAFFRRLKSTSDCRALWEYHLKGVISEYFRGNPKREDKVKEIEQAFLSYDKSGKGETLPTTTGEIKNEEPSQNETLTPANEGSE